jgi:hypothetical protein
MPTMRQSRNVDIGNTVPLPPQPAGNRTPPPVEDREMRRPNMEASMPLMASTGDAFARQFYGAGTNPSYRILPIRRGATA